MTWPARVRRLEGRVDDLEEIAFDELKRVTGHGRRLDAVERRTDLHAHRIDRVIAAVTRLRARVLGRSRQRRKRKR